MKNKYTAENAEVSKYQFKTFDHLDAVNEYAKDGVHDFNLKDISEIKKVSPEQKSKQLKVERNLAEKENFSISPIVRQFRGIEQQERGEREKRIEEEVSRRVEILKKEACEKGRLEGIEKGRQEVFESTKQETEKKLVEFSSLLNEVLSEKSDLLQEQKTETYALIRNLVKWIILRELENDGNYIERLLEKMINELQTKSNLLIQVNKNDFETMPDILEHLESKLGKMKNVRVEIDYDIPEKGIVIESDNGIINGSLEEQFKSLDKLFEGVGLKSESGSSEHS